MTRRIILSLIAMVITVAGLAQTDTNQGQQTNNPEQLQTLFKHSGPVGWWVAPEVSYTTIGKSNAFLGGISGGIIIDHNFSIGLAGMGIITTKSLNYSGINDTANVYLYGGYGGLRLEYRLKALNPVHIAFPFLIGGGGAVYSTWGPNEWHHSNSDNHHNSIYIWDGYFVLEPGVMVGINIIKFMRLDAGVTYRYVSGLNLPQTDKTLLNGFNANFSLKFGRF